jgi:hypothetical protein
MNKFHQMPTDQFVPLSHDCSYLFTHYDKVANFLAFNLDKNYKNILAKPVQNGYVFDWFSRFEGLLNINEYNKAETDTGLIKYWDFIETIKTKIGELSGSYNDDGKNWASLLTKVFNHPDNFIFSNGKDICIVWGWKFNNNEIYKPNLVDKFSNIALQESKDESLPPLKDLNSPDSKEVISTVEKNDVEEVPENLPETPEREIPTTPEEPVEKLGFTEFLKWFAAKFWWLLWLVTFLVAVVFFIKAYYVNA